MNGAPRCPSLSSQRRVVSRAPARRRRLDRPGRGRSSGATRRRSRPATGTGSVALPARAAAALDLAWPRVRAGSAALHASLLRGLSRAVPLTELEQGRPAWCGGGMGSRRAGARARGSSSRFGHRAQGEEGAVGTARTDRDHGASRYRDRRTTPNRAGRGRRRSRSAAESGMIGRLAAGTASIRARPPHTAGATPPSIGSPPSPRPAGAWSGALAPPWRAGSSSPAGRRADPAPRPVNRALVPADGDANLGETSPEPS
jgi:hypothetical protein